MHPPHHELAQLLAALAALAADRRAAREREDQLVDQLLEQGATWQQIADALGIKRQSAHARHAKRPRGRD